MNKPPLHIYVNGATHFLRWETLEFAKYFTLVDRPSEKTILLSFGPDALETASTLPCSKRYAVLFPGFGHNPLYNKEISNLHRKLIRHKFDAVFINPGPLEIAYRGLPNVVLYPFSVDTSIVTYSGPRKKLQSLIHVSSDYPQKDWRRSEEIMQRTGLTSKVYPPRDDKFFKNKSKKRKLINSFRQKLRLPLMQQPFDGYVEHSDVINMYKKYDGFVHVAADIKSPLYLDGKYTASLIEAGLTGCILFWHDTFGLGNNLKTVFNLSLDPEKAAQEILEIRDSIDVRAHSQKTHEEMLETFNPVKSVALRAHYILNDLK